MPRIRLCDDADECRELWTYCWPRRHLFDRWGVRSCFDRAFGRRPCFVVAEQNGRPLGLLALSWIEEEGYYGAFPGETWAGRTWLEGNRIPTHVVELRAALLEAVPGPMHLRYLLPEALPREVDAAEVLDEVGYFFVPSEYEYDYAQYLQEYRRSSRKKLRRELKGVEAHGVEVRLGRLQDVDALLRLNLDAFGHRSYFDDSRFVAGFEALVSHLAGRNQLRVTTVLLGGRLAAVDVGALWRGDYTVLAGGTDPEFGGVAKYINLLHLRFACEQRLSRVDFLCGDFGWKRRFHLSERPLYEMSAKVDRVGAGDRALPHAS